MSIVVAVVVVAVVVSAVGDRISGRGCVNNPRAGTIGGRLETLKIVVF